MLIEQVIETGIKRVRGNVVSEIIGKRPIYDDIDTGLLDAGVRIAQHETIPGGLS